MGPFGLAQEVPFTGLESCEVSFEGWGPRYNVLAGLQSSSTAQMEITVLLLERIFMVEL